jgi:hypothetical protein
MLRNCLLDPFAPAKRAAGFVGPEAPLGAKKTASLSTASPAATRIKQVRDWIATAELAGHAAGDMLLRLTTSDASTLKRHPAVAVHEVTFVSDEMRFLGVKVQEGGVSDSLLERTVA